MYIEYSLLSVQITILLRKRVSFYSEEKIRKKSKNKLNSLIFKKILIVYIVIHVQNNVTHDKII